MTAADTRSRPSQSVTAPPNAMCVVPGCDTPVEAVTEVCIGCIDAFGAMLQPSQRAEPLTEQQIRDRDEQTRAAYKAMLGPAAPAAGPAPQPALELSQADAAPARARRGSGRPRGGRE